MPPGSLVVNRPPSFWDLYRWHVIGAIVLCTAEALLIAGLLLERANRRRAEEGLREGQRELRRPDRPAASGPGNGTPADRPGAARRPEPEPGPPGGGAWTSWARTRQSPVPCSSERMHELSGRVKQLSSAVHELSHQLHPSKLEQLGLVAAVRGLCDELGQCPRPGYRFHRRAGAVARYPADTALCLYRITQEALRNVIKHSGARHARVELRGSPDAISLRIADDGCRLRHRLGRRQGRARPGQHAGAAAPGRRGDRDRLPALGRHPDRRPHPTGYVRDRPAGRRFASGHRQVYHETE